MRGSLAGAAVLALGVAASGLAQQVFPTGVDLVAVDVTVVDRQGRPVADLRAEDFEVRVGGRPRRVTSAQLLRHAETASAGLRAEAEAAAEPAFTSNREAPRGRLVVLVPDLASLSAGGARVLADAARRFLDRLSARDRVALFSIPTGPAVDFTTDHARVAAALEKARGTPPLRSPGFYHVSLAEAYARFAPMGDRRLWCAAWEREVKRLGVSGSTGPDNCPDDPTLDAAAREVYDGARARAEMSEGALLDLLGRLAAIEEAKTVVLLSQGLVTGASGGDPGGNRRLADVADAAAAARASVYTIQADRRFLEAMDVEETSMPGTPSQDQVLLADGLEAIAGYTGGPLLRTVTNADVAFERVATETSATWLLSFEPEAGDRDGRPHDIRVRVRRPAVEVRARPRFVVRPPSAAPADAEARARRALDALLPETDVPIALAAFTLDGRRPEEVRLLVVADVGLDSQSAADVGAGYRVEDESGRAVAGSVGTGRLDPIRSPGGGSLYFQESIALPPGSYRLKLAAATPSGRAGSVERTVTARLRPSGPLLLSDLVVAESGRRESGPLLSVDGRLVGRAARALLELQAPGAAPSLSVQFEVAAGAGAGADLVTGAALRPVGPARFSAEAMLDLQSLPAGRYELRAVVLQGGVEAGRVTRSLDLQSP